MKDMLDARKRGDLAFRDKDFKSAIDSYSQVCMLKRTQIVASHKELEDSISCPV